jgi:hypothetical protein
MPSNESAIIHFTKSLDIVKSILQEGFRVKYCTEVFIDKHVGSIGVGGWASPVVSFCDLTVDDRDRHNIDYGNYGIGLRKQWAIDKRLNPVLYCSEFSPVAETLNLEVEELTRVGGTTSRIEFMQGVLAYVKNYRGKVSTDPDYIFYHEREWRYVPSREDLKSVGAEMFLDKAAYENDRPAYNNKVSSLFLKFNLCHLEYLVVNEAAEIDLVESFLRSRFTAPDDIDCINNLVSSGSIVESKNSALLA